MKTRSRTLARRMPVLMALVVAGAAWADDQRVPADINLFGDDFPPVMEWRLIRGRRIMMPKNTPAKSPPAGYAQILVFRDRRELRGETGEITATEVIWKRPDAGEALHFPLRLVRRIATDVTGKGNARMVQLATPGDGSNALRATVKLPGTDWIFGEATSTDGKTFTVQVGADWKLTVDRSQIEWLYFGQAPAPASGIGESVLDAEEWEPLVHTVQREDGSFIVPEGWLGRAIVPPMRLAVSFEVPEDGEEGTRLWLQPFGVQPNCWGTGTAQIGLGRKEISHQLFTDHFDTQKSPLPKEATEEKGPAKYRLYWDGNDKRIVLQRNGRLMGDWKFFSDKGKNQVNAEDQNFQFEAFCVDRVNDNGLRVPLKFNRVSIAPWNGVLPKAEERETEQDCWSGSKKGDPVSGELQSLSAREMEIAATRHALEDGTFLQLHGPPAAALVEAEARVVLGALGEFNARRVVIHQDKLECETAFASRLEVPWTAVSSISFRPSPPPPPPDSAMGDMLVFKNGDELPGQALSASLHDGVRWKTATGQEVAFQPGRIAGFRLSNTEVATTGHTASPTTSALVELRSGERLGGKLLACDDRQVHLDHPQLGPIAIDRPRLWHLFPRLSLEAFGGQGTGGGWAWGNQKTDQPRDNQPAVLPYPLIQLNGTYIVRTGNESDRAVNEMPGLQHAIDHTMEQFEIRMDAVAPGQNATNFMLTLRGENGSFLSLYVSWMQIQVNITTSQNHRARWRRVDIDDKTGEPPLRRSLRLFVNTKAGTCDVELNGRHVTRIGPKVDERLAPSNYTVTISPSTGNPASTVFSNLWVGPWNGDLPRASGSEPPATGHIALSNGDLIPAVPKALQDGKLSVDCDLGELDLPLEKVVRIDFGGAMENRAAPAQVRLKDGTLFNADAWQWDGQALTARSAILGDVRLSRTTVQEIIYDPPPPRAPSVAPAREASAQEPEKAAGKGAK